MFEVHISKHSLFSLTNTLSRSRSVVWCVHVACVVCGLCVYMWCCVRVVLVVCVHVVLCACGVGGVCTCGVVCVWCWWCVYMWCCVCGVW